MKLTQLSKECLQNMPMLIDSICYTTEVVGEMLDPYYDKIYEQMQGFLSVRKELKYAFDERNSERRVISIFPNKTTTGRRKRIAKLDNTVSIFFSLIFFNQRRRNIVNEYIVEFGYLSDSDDNIIYFNLRAGDNNADVSALDDIAIKIEEPLKWWDIQIEDGSIELRITPDQNLTDEIIDECFVDFMESVLNPLLSKIDY